MNLFKLEKLKITAFNDENRSQLAARPNELSVPFNPESYSLRYGNRFDGAQGINTQGKRLRYTASFPQRLALKLVMDSSGVSETGAMKLLSLTPLREATGSAYDQVSNFLQLAYKMRDGTHEPTYLTLKWGKMTFNCRLNSVDVRYTLFSRSGIPIRAELDTVFTGDLEDPTGSREKNSPDLTHYRVIKQGDTLPLLCQEIYGSPDHYLMVARVNRLNSFRNLKPGSSLIFPPLTA